MLLRQTEVLTGQKEGQQGHDGQKSHEGQKKDQEDKKEGQEGQNEIKKRGSRKSKRGSRFFVIEYF